MKTLVIAGTASGVGKTTISLGLMAAFREQGLRVQPFKVGPDFIDPLFHKSVCERPSRNLDGWLMDKETVLSSFRKASEDADLCVIEGVMGLFDGYDAQSEAGSTAEVAKWLGAPVILVVDARSMARSAGALVRGFETFDPDLNVAGVIFNRVGSVRHLQWLNQTVKTHCGAQALGGIFVEDDLAIPERHLGLSTDIARKLDKDWIERLGRKMQQEIDCSSLLSLAEIVRPCSSQDPRSVNPVEGESVRVGVALDEAFCFYYQDNLDLLAEMGAELIPFSPLHDRHLPQDLQGLYLGGGYPEVYAQTLGKNSVLLDEIRGAADSGLPIYSECGGMILLSRGLHDTGGNFYPMAGVFSFETEMLHRRQALGYVTVTCDQKNLLGNPGEVIRGHEFHYSRIVKGSEDPRCTTRVQKRAGEESLPEGFMVKNTYGSYVHLHFASNPEFVSNLVMKMKQKSSARS